MKNNFSSIKWSGILSLIILIVFNITSCRNRNGNSNLFYYGTNEKIYLLESTTQLIVKLDSIEQGEAEKLTAQWGIVESRSENTFVINVEGGKSAKALVSQARQDEHVLAANPMYLTNEGAPMGVTDIVILDFKKDISSADKQKLFEKYNGKDVTTRRIMGFFSLMAIPKDKNALSVSNEIFESGLVNYAHPNFVTPVVPHYIPNDQFYPRQFYLHNTGQLIVDGHHGVVDADIDAQEAWECSRGSNTIVIAVIDDGVIDGVINGPSGWIAACPGTYSHHDFGYPIKRLKILPGSNFGFNPSNPNIPNPVSPLTDKHGTACAGIISAEHNNQEGVAGIAPKCIIMPIRITFSDPFDPTKPFTDLVGLASAINFAWTQQADIISCSWGFNTQNDIPVITAAINNAVTQGRGNKGCVVAFSASNSANHIVGQPGYVAFPANVTGTGPYPNLAYVITVGATDRNDLQANYSPNGATLDVVAPSSRVVVPNQISGECGEVWTTDVPTQRGYNKYSGCTDIPCGGPSCNGTFPGCITPEYMGTNFIDYTARFGGTSAACPQVAGIAALMLSQNPSLTCTQVFDCITKSCDKIGNYTYTTGKSMETGYGRVNARNTICGHLWAKDTPDDVGVEPNRTTSPIYLSPDIWVRNQNDGLLIHQNPEFGQQNFVYVRVRNAGCMSGIADIKLYWAKASPSLSWPKPWDGSVTFPLPTSGTLIPMGNLIGTISSVSVAGNTEIIVPYSWNPPNPSDYSSLGPQQDHFCLLARFERTPSSPFGMTNTETSNLGGNVVENNNVIWKNVTVVDTRSGIATGGGLVIGNFTERPEIIRLKFSVPQDEKERNIIRQGQVVVTLSDSLTLKWNESGNKSYGITIEKGKIIVNNENAWIGDILLSPTEFYGINIQFILENKLNTKENIAFNFDVTQYAIIDGEEVFRGGERYVINGNKASISKNK